MDNNNVTNKDGESIPHPNDVRINVGELSLTEIAFIANMIGFTMAQASGDTRAQQEFGGPLIQTMNILGPQGVSALNQRLGLVAGDAMKGYGEVEFYQPAPPAAAPFAPQPARVVS